MRKKKKRTMTWMGPLPEHRIGNKIKRIDKRSSYIGKPKLQRGGPYFYIYGKTIKQDTGQVVPVYAGPFPNERNPELNTFAAVDNYAASMNMISYEIQTRNTGSIGEATRRLKAGIADDTHDFGYAISNVRHKGEDIGL